MGTYQQLHLDCQVWREEGGGTKVVGEGERAVTRRQEGMKGENKILGVSTVDHRATSLTFDLNF